MSDFIVFHDSFVPVQSESLSYVVVARCNFRVINVYMDVASFFSF